MVLDRLPVGEPLADLGLADHGVDSLELFEILLRARYLAGDSDVTAEPEVVTVGDLFDYYRLLRRGR